MGLVARERWGKFVGYPLFADQHGGKRQPGMLVADTLDEVRAMLPRGLTRWERASIMSPVLIVLSKASIASDWVEDEVNRRRTNQRWDGPVSGSPRRHSA